jgi:hypothetical protein
MNADIFQLLNIGFDGFFYFSICFLSHERISFIRRFNNMAGSSMRNEP